MEGGAKLLYVVVVDGEEKREGALPALSFRYTRPVLQNTLQLMGCKGRHAFKLYALVRDTFLNVVCDALAEYKYVGPNQRADLMLACRIRERKESVTILLCGTSGCGKSTLSALLGSRLGITTVISTDSIRHMMRSFVDEKHNPLLWASTYHAGECLDPMAVAEAKAKRKAKKSKSIIQGESLGGALNGKPDNKSFSAVPEAELIGRKQMAIEGFKAQSEMIMDSLDRLITAWEERKESVVVEGVHLSLNFVMGLMKKHPSIIPFMVYITNEGKHMERCRRRRENGEAVYDPATNTVSVIDEEYRNQCAANSLSSKGMFQLIQRMGSSRNLMADLNTDGSDAKAWPVGSIVNNEKTIYGSCDEKFAGPIHSGSIEDLRFDGTDNGSKYFSSCCSSPRISDGPAKKLKVESSVSVSDEEADDPLSVDSDGDSSEANHDEIEGSVDEESIKSDEEYEGLAMRDDLDNGYFCDNDKEPNNEKKLTWDNKSTEKHLSLSLGNNLTKKYLQNLDLFQKISTQTQVSLISERRKPLRSHSRSQSISSLAISQSDLFRANSFRYTRTSLEIRKLQIGR
ncbi:hypothetical protein J5N97_023190 [Dioscorea zingiberensis]|uniref:Uncharacterized protein n=1 Tax=Dioscorea zingiberensis TaxID=325984 RepID=A0A9D5CCJ2_9LILI|nr:hypothetical protein J5N97_023190 [Dioscorea zingiberensis]